MRQWRGSGGGEEKGCRERQGSGAVRGGRGGEGK